MIFRVPIRQHGEILGEVLARLFRAPMGTGITVLVLAAALTLPATFWIATDNLDRLSKHLEAPGTITLFLKTDRGKPISLEQRLRNRTEIIEVLYVSPEEALDEASRLLGLGESLEELPENPLPGSFEITVAPNQRRPARMATLAKELQQWSGVDQVQYDRRWVERFQAAVAFLRRIGAIVGVLVGGVVVLVIANTIRLSVANRRREIEVIKLVGGTNAFIRLPFLYIGLIQGLLAALLASGLVAAGVVYLRPEVADLAAQYGAQFTLHGPSVHFLEILPLLGGGLGWLGSRLAVGRHLRAVEPD